MAGRIAYIVMLAGIGVVSGLALADAGMSPVAAAITAAAIIGMFTLVFFHNEKQSTITHEQLYLALHDPSDIPRVGDALAEIERGEVVSARTERRKPALLDRSGVRAEPQVDLVAWADVTSVTVSIREGSERLAPYRSIDIVAGEPGEIIRLPMRADGFVPVFAMVVALTPHAEHIIEPID